MISRTYSFSTHARQCRGHCENTFMLWCQRKMSATWSQVRRATASVVLCAQVSAADCNSYVLCDSAAAAAAAAAAAKKMIRQTRAQVVNPALLLHAISRWRLLPFTGHKYFVGKAKAVVTTRLYVSTSTRRRTTAIRRRTTVERLSNRSRMGVERRASNRSRIETESPA